MANRWGWGEAGAWEHRQQSQGTQALDICLQDTEIFPAGEEWHLEAPSGGSYTVEHGYFLNCRKSWLKFGPETQDRKP